MAKVERSPMERVSVQSLVEENKRLRKKLAEAQKVSSNNNSIQYYSSEDSEFFAQENIKQRKIPLKQPKSRIRLSQEPRKPNNASPQSQASNISRGRNKQKRKADPARIEMYNQLIKENHDLRDKLFMDELIYLTPDDIAPEDIDQLIENLVNDNDILKLEVQRQEAAQDKTRYTKHEMFIGLEGNRFGCQFWVPLSESQIAEEQERDTTPLPLPAKPTKPRAPCSKCEKAMLMISRIPPYPPNSTEVTEDETKLIANFIFTGLGREVSVRKIERSLFYWRMIEMERTMHNLRVVSYQSNEIEKIARTGFDSAVIVAEHFKYINDDLKANGKATFLLCAADAGSAAKNLCGHTTVPTRSEIEEANATYDSLYFKYHGAQAMFVLKPERIIPLFYVMIEEPN